MERIFLSHVRAIQTSLTYIFLKSTFSNSGISAALPNCYNTWTFFHIFTHMHILCVIVKKKKKNIKADCGSDSSIYR